MDLKALRAIAYNEAYILKTKDNKFVAIDQNSGGLSSHYRYLVASQNLAKGRRGQEVYEDVRSRGLQVKQD